MKRYFFIKLLVVCIFMIVAYMICDLTQYYVRPIYYRDDEIRVVVNDAEVTRDFKDNIILKNDKVMLSFDIVKKYFDKYIYFDEKYKTVIITNDIDIAKLKLDENKININGINKDIKFAAFEEDDNIYIPIEELQEVYDIEVINNEKIIITTNKVKYKKIKFEDKEKIKLYKKELSLTTGKIMQGDVVTVFDTDIETGYTRVRLSNGNLGYIKNEKIVGNIIFENGLKENDINNKKINLTWEYAENYTPNRNNEAKIEGLDVISPTWIYVKNTNGEIKTNTISNDYIKWAKNNGYKLWPILKNDGLSLDETSAIVTDMKARENLINNVIEVALKYKFEGINLDFENMYKEDKEEFSEFVRELSVALRRNGLVASVDVNVPDGSETWSLCYEHKPIADAADYLILMAYDQYGISQDGPIASLTWVENNLNKLIEREEIDSSKIILGVPFYSKYRRNKITILEGEEQQIKLKSYSLNMKNAKDYLNNSKYKNYTKWDEELGQYYIEYRKENQIEKIWIEDENALKKKVELINKYNLAGVASWRWGFETSEAWKVISSTLNN